jgi:hypothetical protein
MKTIILFFTGVFLSANVLGQCPPEGRTNTGAIPDAAKQQLDKKKNRSTAVHSRTAEFRWDLKATINSPRHNDRADFRDGEYGYVEGYITEYKAEGKEDCNCHMAEKRLNHPLADIHINLGLKPNAVNDNTITVEITPDYKKRNPGYIQELQRMKGKKVRIWGYTLYDGEHEKNSLNFCTSCTESGVWRKSCWEIHPIVAIEQIGN